MRKTIGDHDIDDADRQLRVGSGHSRLAVTDPGQATVLGLAGNSRAAGWGPNQLIDLIVKTA